MDEFIKATVAELGAMGISSSKSNPSIVGYEKKISLTSFLGLILILAFQNLHSQELREIRIDDIPQPGKTTNWLKENSNIKVFDDANETKVTIEITLDSGWISVVHDTGWIVETDSQYVVEMYYDHQDQGSLFIKLSNEIMIYQVEIKSNVTNEKEFVLIQAKLGNELNFASTDLLILPLIYKVSVLGFRWFVRKKAMIRIVMKN